MFHPISLAVLILALNIPTTAADLKPTSGQANVDSVSIAPIQDNSFLIEEAYNQEDGVVQHISYLQRSFLSRDWVFTQTDEWPIRNLKHQLSLTMSAAHTSAYGGFGMGDTAINYRHQLVGNGEAKLAVAPPLSLLLPTGNYRLER
jgi:hypothetical protein